MTPGTRPARRAALIGAAAGLVYGVFVRGVVDSNDNGFLVMTSSFVLLVPAVVGFMTVYAARSPSWLYRLFMPWLPTLAAIGVSMLVGWEGSICVIIAAPLMLIGASLGGVVGWLVRPRIAAAAIVFMPLLGMPLEAKWPGAVDLRAVESEITIQAPLDAVWGQVVTVPEIQPSEQRPALFTAIGFPRPLDATLSHEGVGGVRRARFGGGILFVETVTDWQPEVRLSFTIDAPTDSVQLDQHVTVGGPFFDVLTGTYTLTPNDDGSVLLRLRSEHRLSTRFNLYAGLWTDAIMRSIQRNILLVLKTRAESGRV